MTGNGWFGGDAEVWLLVYGGLLDEEMERHMVGWIIVKMLQNNGQDIHMCDNVLSGGREHLCSWFPRTWLPAGVIP